MEENIFVVYRAMGTNIYRLRAVGRSSPPVVVYSETPLVEGQRVRLDVVVLPE